MIQSLGGVEPDIHESAYVHPTATVIGDVTMAAESSVWPGVVLRGDDDAIVLHEGVNVQDNAVCHEAVEIGAYSTVGHGAIVHDCSVGERALIAMNAVVLDGSTIGDGAIVAAGAVVTENTDVPPNSLFAGTPAKMIREEVEGDLGAEAADHYVGRIDRYRSETDIL